MARSGMVSRVVSRVVKPGFVPLGGAAGQP